MRTRLEAEPKFIMEKGKKLTPARTPVRKRVQRMEEVIEDRAANHPLVIHFNEDHGGEIHQILWRTLLAHLTPMERKIQESMNIIE